MAECPATVSPDLPQPTLTHGSVHSVVENHFTPEFAKLHLNSASADGDSKSATHEVKRSHSAKHSTLDDFLRLGLSPMKPNGLDISDSVSENDLAIESPSNHTFASSTVAHPSSSPVLVPVPSKPLVAGDLPPAESPSMPSLTRLDVTHILDGLYLSDFVSLSAAKLRKLGVTFVVNATCEVPLVEGADASVEFLKLGVDDVPTENIGKYFDVCADRIHDVRSNGGGALIHCALGISRSVSICLAYLVKYEGRTLRQAYFEVKKKRPIIRPNDGFWRQLIAFEVAKRGRATVKLNIYPMGVIPDVYRGAPRTATTRGYPHFR